jgi:copper chaperone CopZ
MADRHLHATSPEGRLNGVTVDERALMTSTTAYLFVIGMGCDKCAARVRDRVHRLDGVLAATVHLREAILIVAFDPSLVTRRDLEQAVAAAGYDGRYPPYRADTLLVRPTAEVPATGTASERWS